MHKSAEQASQRGAPQMYLVDFVVASNKGRACITVHRVFFPRTRHVSLAAPMVGRVAAAAKKSNTNAEGQTSSVQGQRDHTEVTRKLSIAPVGAQEYHAEWRALQGPLFSECLSCSEERLRRFSAGCRPNISAQIYVPEAFATSPQGWRSRPGVGRTLAQPARSFARQVFGGPAPVN